jgi:hypothetical protein
LPFKCNLQRYNAAANLSDAFSERSSAEASVAAVGKFTATTVGLLYKLHLKAKFETRISHLRFKG